MKSNKKVLSVLIVALLLPQIAFAEESSGTVTRTIEGNNYLRVGDISTSIVVKLTGTPEDAFSFWGVIETLPENVNVEVLTGNADVIKNGNEWSFATIDGNILRYTITANEHATVGTYSIMGIFKDTYNDLGTITPDKNIRILPECTDDPVCYYDTNGISGIQRDEALDAVEDYFADPPIITLSDVLKVVRAYLGL